MNAAIPTNESTPTKRYYTAAEVAAILGFDPSTVRRWFIDLPGVLTVTQPRLRGKRAYTNIRISQEALDSFEREHTRGFRPRLNRVQR
jgi:hypothetical protein